jgi:hypoxanthine-DNA glycosylase
MKIFSFPPISNAQSKILILGTMPGKDSLKYNQYYAHSRNAFWKIMFALFNTPFSNDYEVKKSLLLNNNIALWDVLKACKRESSLDSDILEEEPNDLKLFLKNHPQINHLFFNGQSSMNYFKHYVKEISLPHTLLPSTSPAYTISLEKKLNQWSVITELIATI